MVPSDGFFEWQRPDGGGRKTPFYFHRPDDAPIAFAGLGSAWKDDQGRWLLSCVIITTDANTDMREVHDRMPVVLDQVVWDEWLAQEPLSESRLETLLVPPLSGQLEHYEISTAVNDVRNEGEELLAPVAAA